MHHTQESCGSCHCEDGSCGSRRFMTKEEKLKKLKSYKDSLESESKAVAEHITKLEKGA